MGENSYDSFSVHTKKASAYCGFVGPGRDRDLVWHLQVENTIRFPASANAFDSLAEAYYQAGKIRKARSYYERSLSIDPENQNARYMLQKLEIEP